MNDVLKYPHNPILIVDDEPQITQGIDIALKASGITNTVQCQDSRNVLPLVSELHPEVILLDLAMPHVGGEEVLSAVAHDSPDIPVIVVTSTDELETAVRCMKIGAFDYMLKPITRERLISRVKRAMELRELRRENQELKQHVLSAELKHPEAFSEFDCVSVRMRSLFRYVESIAASQEPILITGETGVGKEIMARAIHKISHPKGPFVPVNIAGLDENAFSDTLFGHRKGAFTGAAEIRGGLVEKAEGGILFLDEIGDLDPGMQVKLLRLVQEREYLPLGSDVARRSTARIIVATNKKLEDLRDSGGFRADLFYRLRRHHVHIPPLRERMEDLPYLVNRIIDRVCGQQGKKRPVVPSELLPLLASCGFPGNVRELESMIHDAVAQHSSGRLSLQVFKKWIGPEKRATGAPDTGQNRHATQGGATGGNLATADGSRITGQDPGKDGLFTDKLPTLKQAQEELIGEAMKRAKGNQAMAASMLGISRQALNRRLLHTKAKGKGT